MIIGISGLTYENNYSSFVRNFLNMSVRKAIAGAGKDEVASYFKKYYNCTSISFADPLKEFCQEVYKFSDEQLFGPSNKRNEPDERYPLGDSYLTPRHALQSLGSWGRECCIDTWAACAISRAKLLLSDQKYLPSNYIKYTKDINHPLKFVVIPDVRYYSELKYLREHNAKIIRVIRPVKKIPDAVMSGHASEKELITIPNAEFDYIIENNSTLEHLYRQANRAMEVFGIDKAK